VSYGMQLLHQSTVLLGTSGVVIGVARHVEMDTFDAALIALGAFWTLNVFVQILCGLTREAR